MPLTFQLAETFPVAPERLFAAVTDLDGFQAWMPNLVRVEKLTEGPVGVGTRWREVRKMFGKEAGEVFEIKALKPPRSLRLYVDGTQGSSRRGYYDFRYTFKPKGSGTELVLDAEMGGMGAVGQFIGKYFMLGVFKKAIAKDHAALKAHLAKVSA